MAVPSDAALDDGRLDLYSLKPQPLRSLLAMLPGLMRGPNKSMQGVQLFEGQRIRDSYRRIDARSTPTAKS